MENNEIWMDIKGYEGKYKVSNMGRVYSIRSHKYLAIRNNGRGYLYVSLWKDNKEKKEYLHRLVARHFIPNPNNLPQVNHKDENKENNSWDNLEWCDASYNNNYGTHTQRAAEGYLNNGTNCCKVKQFTLEGEYIATYRSMREAERLNNLGNGVISQMFKKGYKQTGGFHWEKVK